jgi:hypothetical protein
MPNQVISPERGFSRPALAAVILKHGLHLTCRVDCKGWLRHSAVKIKLMAEMRIKAYCRKWSRYEATSRRESGALCTPQNDHLAHHGPDLSFRPFGILPTPLSIYG